MNRWRYRYAGLDVVSEMPIPEWEAFASPPGAPGRPDGAGEPDVRIAVSPPGTGQAPEAFAPGECRFAHPEAGDYLVRDGREIVVRPAPGAGEAEVRLFLLGSAWGVLCYQRGLFPLHAAVVRAGESAVAFCGPSGAGKSTLAAVLAGRGFPVVGDDLCCVDFAGPGPRVHPSAPRLKLWRDALGRLGWDTGALARDHFRLDKFHVAGGHSAGEAPSPFFSAAPLPLRTVCLLDWGETGLVRLTGWNALHRFVASSAYRPEWIERMALTAAYWEMCLRLVREASVWEFRRPQNPAALERGLETLENWLENA